MAQWKAVAARWRWEAALTACIIVSLGVWAVWEYGQQRLASGYTLGLRSMWASSRLGELRALIVDAETGQRGYLLTGRETYLVPYEHALKRIHLLESELREHYLELEDAQLLERFGAVVGEIGSRLKELEFTIGLVREGRADQSLELLRTDIGRIRMDQIRQGLTQLESLQRDRTASLVGDWRRSLSVSRIGVAAISALNVALLVLIVRWLRQHFRRERDRAQELDRVVRERTEQLARLSAHLQERSESEKTTLGRELHDELGAILTAARMDLLWVRTRLGPDQTELLDKLRRAMQNLDEGIAVERRIIEDLRPSILSNFGLMTAARAIAEQAAERAGWTLSLDLPPTDPELEDDVEIAMFRILEEALSNVAKYANASNVRIRLYCVEGRSCELEIEDDGVGFDMRNVRSFGHGLIGMRQRLEPRGGRLAVRSAPGRGTLVQATLPLRARTNGGQRAPAAIRAG